MTISSLLKIARLSAFLLAGVGPYAAAQPFTGSIPGEYIVVLHADARPEEVAQAHGLNPRCQYLHALNGFAANIPEGRLAALLRDPRVAFVEPDLPVAALGQTVPTGVQRIGAVFSPAAKIDGLDERVDADIAILDTGIDLTHPDLNVFRAVSFTSDSLDGNDGHGHGTHVAGIAAALDNDLGVGGVAPGARLWAVKVLDNTGSGFLSQIIKGVDYVTQNAGQIEVANLSLGGQGSSDALRLAIQNSVAKGVVYVVAAGNACMDIYGADNTLGTSDDFFPAAYSEVMAVSAMIDTDGKTGGLGAASAFSPDDTIANFSNYSLAVAPGNPVTSPGLAIDLAAPGVNIYSTYKAGAYAIMSGTSMAAPHVAGAVALYVAQHGRAADATGVAAIRQALIDAAQAQTAWGPFATDPHLADTFPEGLVSVFGDNTQMPPSVSITSPAAGSSFKCESFIQFSGAAADARGANLCANLVWTSNLSGPIGAGASFTTKLWVGTHTISASATDSVGQSTTAFVTVVVVATPTLTPTVRTDKTTYINRETVNIRVTVTDGSKAVAGATVALVLKTANGKLLTSQATTDSLGNALFQHVANSKQYGIGACSATVTAVMTGCNSGTASTTFKVTK